MKRGDFSKGHKPWNKGLKGIHLSPETEFKPGHDPRANPNWLKATVEAGKKRKGIPSPLKGTKIAPTITRNCAYCNTPMELRPCRLDQKYCIGKPCRYLAKRGHRFQGTRDQYRVLHRWVERKLGKPNKCEHCGKIVLNNRYIHWANKSGLYLRDLTDWIRLCSKCHAKYDKI